MTESPLVEQSAGPIYSIIFDNFQTKQNKINANAIKTFPDLESEILQIVEIENYVRSKYNIYQSRIKNGGSYYKNDDQIRRSRELQQRETDHDEIIEIDELDSIGSRTMNLWPSLVTSEDTVSVINRAWSLYNNNGRVSDSAGIVVEGSAVDNNSTVNACAFADNSRDITNVIRSMNSKDLFKIPGIFGLLVCNQIRITPELQLPNMPIENFKAVFRKLVDPKNRQVCNYGRFDNWIRTAQSYLDPMILVNSVKFGNFDLFKFLMSEMFEFDYPQLNKAKRTALVYNRYDMFVYLYEKAFLSNSVTDLEISLQLGHTEIFDFICRTSNFYCSYQALIVGVLYSDDQIMAKAIARSSSVIDSKMLLFTLKHHRIELADIIIKAYSDDQQLLLSELSSFLLSIKCGCSSPYRSQTICSCINSYCYCHEWRLVENFTQLYFEMLTSIDDSIDSDHQKKLSTLLVELKEREHEDADNLQDRQGRQGRHGSDSDNDYFFNYED